MSQPKRPLVGSVFERSSTPKSAPTLNANASQSGFPSVQHRSKSAFTRGREELKRHNDSKNPTLAAHRESEHPIAENEPEEGTPEDIRRRFFPHLPADDPSTAWMVSSPPSDSTDPALRFDLTGTPIPPSLSSSLPTHLGLHHHADGTRAGYTLDDIFLLSRSSVPAQRTTMLGVLVRIARKMAAGRRGAVLEEGMSELRGREDDLRKRMLAAGVEAMGERGSLGARAVEVIWECVVRWDDEVVDIKGVELKAGGTQDVTDPSADAISSLPLEFLLSQITNSLATAALPTESLSQLLAVLHRLAQHANTIACLITTTPNLIAALIRTFLLTPIPPTESSAPPDPSAIDLLTTLAQASRSNAAALVDPADALLRFVTMLPPASVHPAPLATALLTATLQLYAALASYGLHAHTAHIAVVQFARVGSYVLSDACRSARLRCAWAGLVEAWTVCATDPHRTTPPHDILWSQVAGWAWGEDLRELRGGLSDAEADWEVWGAAWRAEGAWLEGARVNGIRGGENERLAAVEVCKNGFEHGKESRVVLGAIGALQQKMGDPRWKETLRASLRIMGTHANTLMSAIRLWLACLPPLADGPPISPPFALPFPQISAVCAELVNHPLWSSIYAGGTPAYIPGLCRSLTALLSLYLRLSQRLPGIGKDLWLAQAFSIMSRLVPGDEEFGVQVVEDVMNLVTEDSMASRGWSVPSVVWEKGGMAVLKPFLLHTFRPQDDVYIGPLCMSPQSILLSTTQRAPPARRTADAGLPLSRDWVLSPLDHLLRSGVSPVFAALPAAWDASETEVVRAALGLAQVARGVLRRYGLTAFVLTREEAVFACMKIIMLEHGQAQSDSADEVFRDGVVGRLMDELLAPFTYALAPSSADLLPPSSTHEGLEHTATRFLGRSTPFYQYYTDFVALYDAISFSHPLFARLLLPPLAMRYPADYRRHLWCDFAHVLRTVRTPVAQALAADLGEYLWPVEHDAQMLGAYLRALVGGALDGFVRLLAVHHVACNIWGDLRDDGGGGGGGGGDDERRGRVLRTVVEQGDGGVVREVVRYRQTRGRAVVVPPECFEGEGEWRVARLACAGRWGGPALAERLRGLLC